MDTTTLIFAAGVASAYAWIRFCDRILGPWLLARREGISYSSVKAAAEELRQLRGALRFIQKNPTLTAEEQKRAFDAFNRKVEEVLTKAGLRA